MGVIANKASIEKLRAALESVSTATTSAATTANTAASAITTLNPNSKSIVLDSSTESSTKKFVITVDDDGLLTATEAPSVGDPPIAPGE